MNILQKKLILTAAIPLLFAGCRTHGTFQLWPENDPVSGAAAVQRGMDKQNSPYYTKPDCFHGAFSPTLMLITEFETCQQTTEYTCGAASLWMVLNHWSMADKSERALAEEMDIRPETNPDRDAYGCKPAAIEKAFRDRGISVDARKTFDDESDFSVFLKNRIAMGAPTLVEWIAWGGHWSVIIGYDTMGTDGLGDDVLIMADPYDTTDHWQDGYTVVPFEHFFYEWLDAGVLSSGITRQVYVAPLPPGSQENYR